MNPQNVGGEDLDRRDDLDAVRRSFHGRLLDRDRSHPPEPPGRLMFPKISGRGSWIGQVVQVLGDGSIFAGGLAIGGGMMLLRRGEPLKGLPGVMLGFGLAFVLASILAKFASREQAKSWTSAARG